MNKAMMAHLKNNIAPFENSATPNPNPPSSPDSSSSPLITTPPTELARYWPSLFRLLHRSGAEFYTRLLSLMDSVLSSYRWVEYLDELGGFIEYSLLSKEAHLETHVQITHSIIGPGVEIGAGSVIRHSVILDNSLIYPGTYLEETLVGFRQGNGKGTNTVRPLPPHYLLLLQRRKKYNLDSYVA